jgi:hypothetical protein
MNKKEWGEMGSPAGMKSGEGALVVVDGGLLVVSGGEEVADKVLVVTARLGVRLARPMASCREEGRQLEAARRRCASGDDVCVDFLRERWGRGHQMMRKGERERGERVRPRGNAW